MPDSEATRNVDGMALTIRFIPFPSCFYVPLVDGRPAPEYGATVQFHENNVITTVDPGLQGEILRLRDCLKPLLAPLLPARQLMSNGEMLHVRAALGTIVIFEERRIVEIRWTWAGANTDTGQELPFDQLPSEVLSVVGALINQVRALSWQHFRARLNAAPPTPKRQVFISYRDAGETGNFATAVGQYLGKAGFYPWYDRWQIHAGESIPGRIAEGIAGSAAALLVVTADYQKGRWATEEMHTAIAKAIEEDFIVIPLLLENVKPPELLRHRRYVNFCECPPEAFAKQMGEVIDAINRVPLNPFVR